MRNTVCLGCGAETISGVPHECDRDILDANKKSGAIGIWPHEVSFDMGRNEMNGFTVQVKPGYVDLFTILHRALDQAQSGKGSDRHANGEAFNDQPIMTITRRHGLGFALGQAEKKITEAHGMVRREELAAAEKEFLGAINYVAAAILRLHELEAQKGK